MRRHSTGCIVEPRRDLLAGASLYGVLAVCATVLMPGAARAQSDLPTGGTVASGSASIATGTNGVTVTQTSDRAIVNWSTFDVGVGKAVVFAQPNAASATLNRVTGGTGSTIAGSISSNGAVYLVNPNGIAITKTGSVQTGGGFVASTLDIADADFDAGKLHFAGAGASGRVSNKGTITAGDGGYVALLGGTVADAGTITVALGKVGLGSGESIALDLSGDGFMRVAVPTAALTPGDTALIEMAGTIAATGGRVVLSAATVKDAVRGVINMPGSIVVDSAIGDGGSIVLLGGDGGTVRATGTLSARATGATGDGGFVETSGAAVDFTGLKVDTSAASGTTGTWLVDPTDLTVDAAAAATISTNLATSNVTLQTTSGAATGPGVQSSGNGDITVNSAVTWGSANTLSLLAYNNIALNAGITGTAGGLTLRAGNNVANTGAVGATGAVNVGIFNLTNGNWSQLTATLPAFFARDFRFTVGRANFLRATGGTGAAATPYVFTDLFGLQGYASRSYLSASATLGGDIDASGTLNWNAGAGFTPIGTIFNGFSGTFNGANHVINGLTINRPTTDFVGLFGSSAGNAPTIRNVGLVGGSVKGAQYVGALFGDLENGSIADSYATVAVAGTKVVGGLAGNAISLTRAYATGTVTSTGDYAGGLVGLSGAFGITDSYATGAVSSTGLYTGGLAGNSSGTISNSYATGSVTATGQYTGGLIGMTFTRVISSYATGAISGTTSVGGLVGTNTNGNATATITNSYWDVYSTGQSQAAGNVTNVVGVTAVTSDPAQSAAANYAHKASAYANLTAASGIGTATPTGFVFFSGGSTRPFLAFETPVLGNPGVITNASNQILLTNSHQLQLTGYNGTTLAASYALANSIDLSETGRAVAGVPGSYAGMWAATGFVPIGTDGAGLVFDGTSFVAGGGAGFSGSLNGNTFVIDRLSINRTAAGNPGSRVGLFGLTTTGTISNLGLTNGTVTGRTFVGGLVGVQNTGTISNAFSGVNVTGTTTNDGGLVGSQNMGGVITGSYATGSVTGTGSVGGLVGIGRGMLSNVYATGTVTATSGASAFGGLVGFMNGGTITNAYATGAVNGGNSARSVGGLVGSASSATIQYAYATGAVTGYDTVGGLIGIQGFGSADNVYSSGSVISGGQDVGGLVGSAQGSLTNGYWDTYASGQLVGGGGAAAVTSDPGQSGAANYAYKASAYGNLAGASGIGTATPIGFAFMAGDTTRPFLAFEVPVAGTPGVRTNATGQVQLVNTHQLQLVGYNATTNAGSYTLGGNIDLIETGRATAGMPGTYSGMWAGTGFVPLGSDGVGNLWNGTGFVQVAYYDIGTPGTATGFTGSLAGGGYSLSNLDIVRPDAQNVGLFGSSSGTISNLTLTGNVTGYVSTGGLIGVQQGGSVTGVTSSVNVTGSAGAAYVGGLVGFASGATIASSSASGVVSATGATGGLVGLLFNSVLTNSSSSATVTGKAGKSGGLVGIVERSTVTGGASTGSVNGVTPGPSYGTLRDGGSYNGTIAP